MNFKKYLPLLRRITQHRLFIPGLLLILIVPVFSFLLRPGIYWNMHDDMQLVRQLEMEKCLYDGQIPCRWTPDLGYGYGYPLFNFYPPFPYFVGQIFRFLGLSFVASVKYTAVLQIILSAFFMYLLASSLFGRVGGLLSALFYAYAPYHAVNIYVRGAMNEAWAAVFFPLILYFSKQLIIRRRPLYLLGLSLSFSGLMLSHNPMLLIFTPVVVVWCLFWLLTSRFQKIADLVPTIVSLSLSALLAFGLSAFFTLPVLFESSLTQIESMFTNYYSYAIHFVSLFQLFISNVWSDGPSIWGPGDQLSFSVGYLHWLIPVFISLYLFLKFLKKRQLSRLEIITGIVIVLAFFSAFMTHERSTFIWKLIPTLQKIQFPWRFLNVTEFLFSLSVGLFPSLVLSFSKMNRYWYSGLITLVVVVLIALNAAHFVPITSGPITDAQKFSGQAWVNQVTGGIYDYLPKTAGTAPKSPAHEYLDQIIPGDADYSLTGQKKGTDWQFFNLTLEKPSVVYLPILAFPEFKVFDNQQPIAFQIEPELGRISLTLDAGQHQLFIKLYNTPIRTIANTLTIFSLLAVAFIAIPKHGRHRH